MSTVKSQCTSKLSQKNECSNQRECCTLLAKRNGLGMSAFDSNILWCVKYSYPLTASCPCKWVAMQQHRHNICILHGQQKYRLPK